MQRNLSIDILKMLLAICVVFLHTHIFYDVSTLLGHSLVQGFFRLAVPIFLVITGYYFFYINNFEKYKTWLTRIFILYAVWLLFYFPIWWSKNLSYNFSVLYNGYFVLWYLISVLFGGSLLYACRNMSDQLKLLLSSLFFFVGVTLQQLGNLHFFHGQIDFELNQYTTHRNFLLVSFPLLTLGWLFNKYQDQIAQKFQVRLWHVLLVIGLVLTESLANYFFISKQESLDQMYSLFIAAPVIFLYVLTKNIPGTHKQLANLSTAIFLIHPLFLYHFKNYFMGQQTLLSFIVLICSVLAGWVLVQINKKVKYLL